MYRTRTINKTLNVDNLNQYQSIKKNTTPRESFMRGWEMAYSEPPKVVWGCKIQSSWVVLAFLRLFRNIQKRW
jgi:hypothetical protein